MIDIYPTILTLTPKELSAQLGQAQHLFKNVQIDIADGVFVQNTTLALEQALRVCNEFPSLSFDFHLMVQDVSGNLKLLDEASKRIDIRFAFVHSAATPNNQEFEMITRTYGVCLSINPDEDMATIGREYDLSKCPAIQIMTVIPGAQGRPFEAKSLILIDQLRNVGYIGKIFIDGAVNDVTTPLLAQRKNQPDVIGPGSYFSKAKDLQDLATRYEKLKEIIAKSQTK